MKNYLLSLLVATTLVLLSSCGGHPVQTIDNIKTLEEYTGYLVVQKTEITYNGNKHFYYYLQKDGVVLKVRTFNYYWTKYKTGQIIK